MSTKLVTDGSIDIPAEIIEQYEIPVVPPVVIIDGKEYLSGVDITLEEFFERQRTAATLPKTSQPSPGQFVAVFEKSLETHERVLYISITSALSGTFNSAQQAAGEFPEGKIVLHDSRTLTGEGGLQVVAAARVLARGGTLEEALAAAQKIQQESKLYIAIDDLTYLIKGGRVGPVAGAIGTILNLKPIITVDKTKGELMPHSRVRSFKAAMNKIFELVVDNVGVGQPGRFMVLHGAMGEEANGLRERLATSFEARWLYLTTTSPTIAAHTGPRAIAVAFAPGDWE